MHPWTKVVVEGGQVVAKRGRRKAVALGPIETLIQDSNEREPLPGGVVKKMWCGDYVIGSAGHVVGIERKAGDLASSWSKAASKGGSLKAQLRRMVGVFDVVVLLWEGNPSVDRRTRRLTSGPHKFRQRHTALRNWLLTCQIAWPRFVVVPTANWEESTDWLLDLVAYMKKGEHYASGSKVVL